MMIIIMRVNNCAEFGKIRNAVTIGRTLNNINEGTEKIVSFYSSNTNEKTITNFPWSKLLISTGGCSG
jgi:hypothetical protein